MLGGSLQQITADFLQVVTASVETVFFYNVTVTNHNLQAFIFNISRMGEEDEAMISDAVSILSEGIESS